MIEDESDELRSRLQRLVDGAPSLAPGRLGERRRTFVDGFNTALMAVAVLVLGVFMLGEVGTRLGPGQATASAAPTNAAETPTVGLTPQGGLARQDAIARASEHVRAGAILVTAVAGRFEEVYRDSHVGPGAVDPSRVVWAVEFEVEVTICPPDGSACEEPRPGRTTVILDFATGEYVAAFTVSPKPT